MNGESFDIAPAEAAINYLNSKLETEDYRELSKEHLSFMRAEAIRQINLERHSKDIPIDIFQLEMALEDIKYVLPNLSNNLQRQTEFAWGHVAIGLLESPLLAEKFWTSCAKKRHGGCMNILASYYFSGASGFPFSIDESIKWHKHVVGTSIKYRCAGIFSAYSLAGLTALNHNYDTGKSVASWLEIARDLVVELEMSEDQINFCRVERNALFLYVLTNEYGGDGIEVIDDALLVSENEEINAVLSAVKKQDFRNIVELIDATQSDYRKCALTHQILMLAQNEGREDLFSTLEPNTSLFDAKVCPRQTRMKQILQSKGQWGVFDGK